jgi:serine/threonine-protein kinase
MTAICTQEATMLGDENKDPTLNPRGDVAGTPYYMAPEVIRSLTLDHRCDIYSLGALSYRILTGENAFDAHTPLEVLKKHLTEEVMPPSQRAPERQIAPELDAVVLKAMAKDRNQRYQSAAEMKRELIELLGISSLANGLGPDHGIWRAATMALPHPYARSEGPLLAVATAGLREVTLSKEDLTFERRLRRRSVAPKLLLPFVLLLLLGGLFYGFAYHRERTIQLSHWESENNNTPDKANALPLTHPIKGHLGRRISVNESDRDWYKFQVEGTGPQILRARLSRIPNMDLTLELYDTTAGRVTSVDIGGKGAGERIANWMVSPGLHFLLVREVWLVDVLPTENVTDTYALRVEILPYEKHWEMEPNDQLLQAQLIKVGQTVRGYLGTPTDLDLYKIESPAGTISGEISGIAQVDVLVKITASAEAYPLIVDQQGPSEGERFRRIRADGKRPVLIQIQRKQLQKLSDEDQSALEIPYTLKTTFTPTAGR